MECTSQLSGLCGAFPEVGGSQERGRRAVGRWAFWWDGELGEEEMGVELFEVAMDWVSGILVFCEGCGLGLES